MSCLPIDVVKKYRKIYKENYMLPTLRAMIKGSSFKVPAFIGNLGFPGSYIVINLGGPRHSDIWASNIVQKSNDLLGNGVIHVNPDLLQLEPERKKAVFAHEFIEVMMALEDGERKGKTLKLEKLPLALIFNNLKRRCFWQDSTDFEIKMHSALRQILVSEESIIDYSRDELGTEITSLKNLVKDSPQETSLLIDQLAKGFSGKHSVDLDLVYDRIQETLFENNNGIGDSSENRSNSEGN